MHANRSPRTQSVCTTFVLAAVVLLLGAHKTQGASQPKTRAGFSIFQYVPPHLLAEGESVDVLVANYRHEPSRRLRGCSVPKSGLLRNACCTAG